MADPPLPASRWPLPLPNCPEVGCRVQVRWASSNLSPGAMKSRKGAGPAPWTPVASPEPAGCIVTRRGQPLSIPKALPYVKGFTSSSSRWPRRRPRQQPVTTRYSPSSSEAMGTARALAEGLSLSPVPPHTSPPDSGVPSPRLRGTELGAVASLEHLPASLRDPLLESPRDMSHVLGTWVSPPLSGFLPSRHKTAGSFHRPTWARRLLSASV